MLVTLFDGILDFYSLAARIDFVRGAWYNGREERSMVCHLLGIKSARCAYVKEAI